jgi:type II secretory pathway pseudopilin PulG
LNHESVCRLEGSPRLSFGGQASSKSRRARRGLTIFELLVVLGIVAMAMAISWPALEEMFLSRRLSDAGTLMRNTLREARRQALEDSITYRIDFSPGSSLCRIVPADDPFQEESSPESSASQPGQEENGFEPLRQVVELPDGVRVIDERLFAEGPIRNDDPGLSATGEPQPEPSPEEASSREWVPIAAFYPDGSATPTTIHLVMGVDRMLDVSVEGLTGEVAIGEPGIWRSESEQEQEEQAQELGLTPTDPAAPRDPPAGGKP